MTQRSLRTAVFLGGCCLFLSSIEYAIPKPLPFLRLGIANVPIMAAVELLPLPAICLVVLLKLVGQALVTGTLFSYVAVLSAVGTACSAVAMYGLHKILYHRCLVSWIGISVAGAAVSNCVQLFVAAFCFMGDGVWLMAPLFLLVGTVSGALLGVLCERYFSSSQFFSYLKMVTSGSSAEVPDTVSVWEAQVDNVAQNDVTLRTNDGVSFCVGSVLLVLLFVMPHLAEVFSPCGLSSVAAEAAAILSISVIALICLRLTGKKVNVMAYLVTIVAITVSNCLVPVGRVLVAIGPLRITEYALCGGIKRAAIFECLMCISRLLVSARFRLPGRFGKLLAASLACFATLSSLREKYNKKSLSIAAVDRILFNAFANIN